MPQPCKDCATDALAQALYNCYG